MEFDLRYAVLDPNLIFNLSGPESVGPTGWTEEKIKLRKEAANHFIDTMNKKQGFFIKLEKSILKNGFRNPILVRCGWHPLETTLNVASKQWCGNKIKKRFPVEMQEDSKKILACYNSGGSRLWVAQKHNLMVPCIITDFIGRFSNEKLIEKTEEGVLKFFIDKPHRLLINRSGVLIQNLPQVHLEEK